MITRRHININHQLIYQSMIIDKLKDNPIIIMTEYQTIL